jgi:YD repeat-containing protein
MRINSILRCCRIHERVVCLLSVFAFSFSFSSRSQTNYSPLYTSANFVKTVDLTKPVGTVGASAGTTPTGGVTYSIPIYTPPGSNGLQPAISVTYNSQSGAGIVGYGWSIAGLSVISRTGKNLYHNEEVSPINFYNNNDAFLLDGTRLNAVWGQHGQNGTIYATESEGFNQIICYKSSPYFLYGPDWFLVTAKDGTKMEFGNTTDSRIMNDVGEHPLLWRLNRILDINGNYIDFKYVNTGRDSRIDEINYTGNINTGLLPNVKIKFIYGDRYETNTSYDGGASLSSLYLLNKITITYTDEGSGGEEPVTEQIKTYQFNYGFDNVHSLLKEVVESGSGFGNPPTLNSTIFLYGDQPQNFSTSPASAISGAGVYFSGGFNADGKSDLLKVNSEFNQQMNTRVDISYSLLINGNILYNKSLPQGTTLINDKKFYNFLATDYNKDGRDEVLEVNTSWSATHLRRQFNNAYINYTTDYGYSASYFQNPQGGYIYLHPTSGNFLLPGDFDGDGNQDYILLLAKWISGTQFEYETFITSPGAGQTNLKIFGLGSGIQFCGSGCAEKAAEANMVIPIDFDGDGKTEILVTHGSQSYLYSIKATTEIPGYSFIAQLIYTTEIVSDCKLFLGDFNGDRKTDILVRNPNQIWKILYSTGLAFTSVSFSFNQAVILNGDPYDHKISIGDFNGDGKSDIFHGIGDGFTTPSYFSLYYGKGKSSGFYYEQYSYNGVLAPNCNYCNGFVEGDFNGDGRTDILNSVNILGSGDFIYFKPNGEERLLQKVTDGHNTTTAFDYKLLTDKSEYPYVYDRVVSLDDPVNLNPYNYVQLPMYVVSSVTSPDGIGGTNSTSFYYEDAVVHRAAKGFLGFRKITSKNTISGITSITENQINTQFAVPYTVKQTVKLTATDELLSESFITNTFVDLTTGSDDKRFFQKIDKILSVDHLSGTASESVNTYDNYGNVTTNVSKVGVLSGSTVDPTETTTTTTVFGIHNTPVPAKSESVTVSNTRTGMPAQSGTTIFTYTTNGLPLTHTVFYGLPKAVTTTYTYNSFGNVTQTVTSSSGLSNRVSAATYDSRGRFPLTKQKIGSTVTQTETYTYDGKWGKPFSQKSTDGLTTTFEYDIFGRLKKTNLPAGYSVNISLNWDIQGEQVFYSLTDYPGGDPDEKIWYDKAGREIKRQIAGFNNQWLTQLTIYDTKGNINTKTNTYYSNETPFITSHVYDVYNRHVFVGTSLNYTNTTFTKLTGGKTQITVENSAGQSSSKIVDASGKTISAIDNGGQLDYTYDSRGNQTEVKHGSTVLVTSTYDIYGRQTSLVDKNAGTITYQYDAYGQLTQQTDNLANTYNMGYDDLGRLITRRGQEGTTT